MVNTDLPRAAPPESPAGERLDSWKEIAAYLKRDVRTVHRWEHSEGLPVHRHPHQSRGSVYAFRTELDVWWNKGHGRLEPSADKRPVPKRWPLYSALVLLGLLTMAVLLNFSALRDRFRKTAAPLEIQSIAVLPLINLSGDSGQEYFVDGMTEELITNLGKIGGLRVISHTSVRRFKGTTRPVPEIARELNVDAIVEGMVLRSGDRVRITTNLIQARTDRHIWAESYERDLGDVLNLQSELARTIGKEIRSKLVPSEPVSLSSKPVNPEAYDAYLRGGSILDNWTEEGAHLAIKYFERALELDPAFAPAYAGLAETYIFLGRFGYRAPGESFAKARDLANKALARDSKSAEAYTSLCGIATYYDWNWSSADATCRRAIELNPNHASAHHTYAHYLVITGQFAAALQESLLYLELDPLSPAANTHLAMHYDMARQFDLAAQYARKAVELDPNFPDAYSELTGAYLGMGKPREAVLAAQQAVNLSKDKAIYLGTLGKAYADAGMRHEATKVLGEIRELSERRFVDPTPIAIIHIALGNKDEAFRLLEKAEEAHDQEIVYLKVLHGFDPLRGDPRFQALLRRMNFPQ